MSKFELKPCPFCGSKNVVLEENAVRKGFEASIYCNGDCMATQYTITYDTPEEAREQVIKLWNRRIYED